MKRGLYAFAKSIESCQPAKSAQADMGQNFSPSVHFLHFEVTRLHRDMVECLQNTFYGSMSRICFDSQ